MAGITIPNLARALKPVRGRDARRKAACLYSALSLTTLAVSNNDYFSTGVGQTGQGFTPMTITQTNLRTGGRIPDQQQWIITEMGFYISDRASVNDNSLVLNNGAISIDATDYQFVYGPPFLWPAGVGQYTAATTVATNGFPSKAARMKLSTPLILDPGSSFIFRYSVTAAQTISAAVTTYMVLWGEVTSEIVQG